MATIHEIASDLDAILHTDAVPDYGNALNGMQVENRAAIAKVAAAVDARTRTIRAAIQAGANLLLVHHGLFWGGLMPLRGAHLRRIRLLLDHDIALYSAHLPLDAHPELGNNVLLARELGLSPDTGFARYKTVDIGVAGTTQIPTAELLERATRFAARYGGAVRHSGFDAERVTKLWAICTGAGASAETLQEAAARGIDTLIVGEGPHWTAIDADELGITVIYAGHYATETLGVQALATYVANRYGLSWQFIDVPTGL
ncbi:MAG TPA: Nif3-like dinuclear metal center hexameric protein [Gemmatimonadaceae bacterium]|nr:Nif3-like dinuclear metal center hexameric protein [Gemmatimonadaceae bacterium]